MQGFPFGDFLAALGLALVLEGAAWLAAPLAMRRFVARMAQLSPVALGCCGLAGALRGRAAGGGGRQWV